MRQLSCEQGQSHRTTTEIMVEGGNAGCKGGSVIGSGLRFLTAQAGATDFPEAQTRQPRFPGLTVGIAGGNNNSGYLLELYLLLTMFLPLNRIRQAILKYKGRILPSEFGGGPE